MNIFEKKYQKTGFESQRKYPNESLVAFASGINGKVLDLGCGSGANTWFLAKEGKETYGIDSSPTAIKLCKKMLKKWGIKAKLKVGKMTELPYKNDFFDAVVDVVSLQHLNIKEHEKSLEEIHRVLKPNGKFFSFHLGNNSISNKGKKIDKFTIENIADGLPLANNGPTCFLTTEKTKELLNDFKDINVEKITRTYQNQKIALEYLIIKAIKK